MEKSEIRKKRIPGTRELFSELKRITESIQSIEDEIKSQQETIRNLMAEERKNSPRAKIFSDLKEAKEIIDTLRMEKKNQQAIVDDAKSKIQQLRESMGQVQGGYDSIDKINKRLEDLELKLIATSINAKEENEIASSMSALNEQKSRLSDMETNVKMLESLDETIKSARGKIGEINKELMAKNTAVDSLRAELDKLSEESKTKSPEVTQLENKIAALKTQKSDLVKQRNTKREEVHTAELEYSKFEAELLIQKSLEEQKDSIKKRISDLRAEKDALLNEQSAYNPEVYDSLVYALEKIRKTGRFTLEIDLVTQLIKYGMPVPNNAEVLDKTIAKLNEKRQQGQATFDEKKGKIGVSIQEIDSKIIQEMDKLNSLPETNYEVLKKGGFRSNLRGRV